MKTKRSTRVMFAFAGSLLAIGSMSAQETPHQRDSLVNLNKNAIQQISPGEGHSAGASGFWGYAFGDYAYMAKGDSAGRGTKQQYKGLGAYSSPSRTPNAFEVRRAYLGYDYTINKKFSAYALMAYEGDEDVNDDRTVYLKYIYLKWKNIWKGTNLKIGQQATNSFASDYNTEPLLGYRAVEKTIMDMHGVDGSSDMGLTLEGKIWTYHGGDTAKVPLFIGYSAMVGDNSGNAPVTGFTGAPTSLATATPAITLNPFNNTTDVNKKYRGQLYVNCLNNALTVGIYADYINYGNVPLGKSSTVFQQSVMTNKVYAVYNSKWFGIGGEWFMQTMKNGEIETFATITDPITKAKTTTGVNDTTNAVQTGFSVFAHGTIIQNTLNVFARYDMYTPDNKYSYTHVANGNLANNASETFTERFSNTSGVSPYKETFMNFGVDWTPTKDKKVHIMPNVWYYGIKNGYGSGDLGSTNYMLYRLTFLFAFN